MKRTVVAHTRLTMVKRVKVVRNEREQRKKISKKKEGGGGAEGGRGGDFRGGGPA